MGVLEKYSCSLHTYKYVIMLVHMDEKWLYVVVTRLNYKVLTSIVLDPVDYYAHHKKYTEKEMYIVVTAYILNNNDIRGGGNSNCLWESGKDGNAKEELIQTSLKR